MEDTNELIQQLALEVAKLREQIESAFPDGDVAGHCAYHELLMEKERRRIQLYDAIIEKTLGALVWAVIVGGAAIVWNYLKMEIKK